MTCRKLSSSVQRVFTISAPKLGCKPGVETGHASLQGLVSDGVLVDETGFDHVQEAQLPAAGRDRCHILDFASLALGVLPANVEVGHDAIDAPARRILHGHDACGRTFLEAAQPWGPRDALPVLEHEHHGAITTREHTPRPGHHRRRDQ